MKKIILFYKHYLNFLSVVAPKYGGKVAVNLFQRVRLKTPKRREQIFFTKAKSFKIPFEKEAIFAYELGNPNGKLVFLVHGWDSNAGSLGKIADALIATNNYRIIAFDLPAHHQALNKYTNLFEAKNAFKQVLKEINPQAEFSVVAHSFGAAVTAFALSETKYKVNKIVFLSGNDVLEDVFRQFQKTIGFNDKIYNEVAKWTHKIIKQPLKELVVSDRLKQIDFKQLLLIHDKKDKVLPFKNAESLHQKIENSVLIPFEKIGHYRMLWNDDVVNETVDFLEN
jgi:pimeloyl-ACP methyl ester carboxylesterase